MTEDARLPRKTVIIDGKSLLLIEPVPVPITQGDVVTEIRLSTNGGLVLGLASLTYEGEEAVPELAVTARLRISPEALAYIEQWLVKRRAAAAQLKQAAN